MDAGRRGGQLLERLTGRRAHLIRVVHTLMVGRPFHCWSSAQQTDQGHAAQTLAWRSFTKSNEPPGTVALLAMTRPGCVLLPGSLECQASSIKTNTFGGTHRRCNQGVRSVRSAST